MKIGEEAYVHGYIDEIRNGVIIIRNKGGYFGTEQEEVFPSAQPERKKGKWIITKTERGWNCAEYPTEVTCSNCNYIEDYQKALDFCPNCGADMRGEQDG